MSPPSSTTPPDAQGPGHTSGENLQTRADVKPWTKTNPLVYNMQSILQRGKALLTPSGSNPSLHKHGFTTAKGANVLFPAVDPSVDGEECLHDCASCSVSLPRKWSIDEDDSLFGHVNGWESHVIVATGKTDWVRDVTDEKGSLMERIGQVSNKGKQLEFNGRQVMLSASDIPTGRDHGDDDDDGDENGSSGYPKGGRTRCLVLPSWKLVEGVRTDDVEWMMMEVVSRGNSNVHAVRTEEATVGDHGAPTAQDAPGRDDGLPTTTTTTTIPQMSSAPPPLPPPDGVSLRSCPHQAIILMCSHKTRDWRCGASAPLLRKEFERHLRPLGLYRDVHDERPGGVGIYFINHVGGHKYSANVMIYRRQGSSGVGTRTTTTTTTTTATATATTTTSPSSSSSTLHDEAVQGIWLARVRPEDCENIVRYTILQGKLVKPQRQLRGGFDRERGLTSW